MTDLELSFILTHPSTEKYYEAQFSGDDHKKLYNSVKDINGNSYFLINNCEYVWSRNENFHIEAIDRNNNHTSRYTDKDKRYGELY